MPTPESNKSEQPSSQGTSKGAQSGKSTPTSSSSAKKGATKNDRPVGGGTIEKKEQPKKRVSRREKDDQNTRILYAVLAAAGILIAAVLAGQAINQYYLIPNKVLATVNGTDIIRKDYWKYRSNTLVNQISQYQQYASFFQGDQQQQYLAMAQQASAQLDGVWGSKDTDPNTLNAMIDDRLYLDNLDSLGLSMTDEDVQNFIDNRFSNQDAPLFTPTPTATLIPERAAWATGTAGADIATQTAMAEASIVAAGSPIPVASPEGAGTVTAAVEAEGTVPAAIPESAGTPGAGTPVPDATSGTPMASPQPTQTLSQDEIRETATANFDNYSGQVFKLTHMNHDDYVRLVAEPALARELVHGYYQEQVGQSAEQVHARHILVGTEELADKIAGELKDDPSKFEELAKEDSIDTATAPNGGDLGWFTAGVMVPEFEKVAFGLEPGQISAPFQTQFGWHIVEVIEKDNDRALTDDQITQAVSAETDRWLSDQRDAAKISSVIKATPTPAIEQFVPPAGAPTVSPATPLPAETGVSEQATPIPASPTAAE